MVENTSTTFVALRQVARRKVRPCVSPLFREGIRTNPGENNDTSDDVAANAGVLQCNSLCPLAQILTKTHLMLNGLGKITNDRHKVAALRRLVTAPQDADRE